MKQITTDTFKEEVLNYKGVVLVDFYADWCGPCRMLGPILEQVDAENKDTNIKLVKLNVDDNQKTAMEYNVMSIPTVIIFKDGKVFDQKVGVQPKSVYAGVLQYAKG
jgi:thioredoxin 1